MSDEKLCKDILLICKHRYNTEKYKKTLEAFQAYYLKHYGCEDVVVDYKLVVQLFLKPCVIYFLTPDKINHFLNLGLFDESFQERRLLNQSGCSEFYEVLYFRLMKWLCLLPVREQDEKTGEWKTIINFSEYHLDDDKWSII